MLVLDAQRATVVVQSAQFSEPELALAAQFASLLFGARGNPDRPQLACVPVQVTRKPHAQFGRI